MNEEQEKELLNILTNLPSESSWLDYKLFPYDNDHKAEFIKDVCSFLNCTDSYGKDKFIVIGVVDKEKYKKGIEKKRMDDDKYYQDLCEMIQPRPHVETGIYKFEEKYFGYILISKDNMERVYSIIKDYPDETVTKEEEKNDIKKKVYASTAYIRKGSVKYLLNEYDRRRIYEQDQQIKNIENKKVFSYSTTQVDDEFKEVLKNCALFGTWNDKNENEREIISRVIGKDYNVWIKTMKRLLSQKSEYVSYKNNCWKIEKKEELIERYCDDYFDNDIENFRKVTIEMLKEEDPRFDLEPDKRMMSSILGKKMLYSKAIKKSSLETFSYMKSILYKFSNCEQELKKSFWSIDREILENASWKLYATLDDLLMILAEIDGKEYLRQINNLIRDKDNIKKLFEEKEERITITNYTSGLYWSLQILVWDSNNLMNVFEIYCKLEKYDKNIVEEMTRIILPWYPQTQANFTLRKAVVIMTLNEYPKIGWKLLMKLMPNVERTSSSICKPKWNGLVEEVEVTNGKLYKEYNEYVKLAIDYSKNNINRIKDLVNIMEDVPKEIFNEIYNKVTSIDVINMKDEEKYIIWDEIEKIIAKHKKFSKSDWALPLEAVNKLEEMSKKVKPISYKIYLKRIFNKEYWNIYDSEQETYEDMEKRILNDQIKAVELLLTDGIEEVIKFSYTVKDPFKVGFALANIIIDKESEKKIIKLLNNKQSEIAEGYVKSKVINEKNTWIDELDVSILSIAGKVRFLMQLQETQETWEFVTKWLGEDELEYWKNADIRVIRDDSSYDYVIRKLIEADRPVKALELINMALFEKKQFSRELSIIVLKNCLKKQEYINYIDIYDIKKLIKDLQDNDYAEDELFGIEWSYLPILSEYDDYRPITIERKLSEEPQIFNDVLCLIYKAHKDKKNNQNDNEKLASNAYRLLNIWRLVPGYDKDGKMNKSKLNKWFNNAIKIAKENDRLEVALMSIGHVFYYTKEDPDGFWIDRNVAEILNKDENEEVRKGYSTQAFNALGVVNVDKEGTVWLNQEKKWKKRAELCQMDYFRFANTLRELANTYHEHAEYEKQHYSDFY